MKAHSPRQGTGYGWGVSETGQDKTRQGVGAISIHLLVRCILVLPYFSHLGEYCTGCGSSREIGYIYRCDYSIRERCGWRGTHGSYRRSETHFTDSILLIGKQHWVKGPILCQIYTFIINGNTTQREFMPGLRIICNTLGTL